MAAQTSPSTIDKLKTNKPQTNKPSIEKPQELIETTTVDLSAGKPLAALPAATILLPPVRCNPSGTTFYDILADSSTHTQTALPQLYSIDHLGDVKHLQRNLPPNYQSLNVLTDFASSQALVSLVRARGKVDPFDPKAYRARDYFLVRSNNDGTSGDPIKIDLKFTPKTIGVFESGRFVVLGIDEVNRVPALAIFESDGTLHKTLDLDNRTLEKDQAANRIFNSSIEPSSKAQISPVLAALFFAEFVSDGPNLILFQGHTSLPARVIGDEGELSEFSLTTPPGFVVLDVLASDPNGPIVARLQSEANLSKSMQDGGASEPTELFAEFSRETGKMIKWIRVTGGPVPYEVTCATNGELTAIYWPPVDEKPATDTAGALAKDKPPADKPPKVTQLLFAKAPF